MRGLTSAVHQVYREGRLHTRPVWHKVDATRHTSKACSNSRPVAAVVWSFKCGDHRLAVDLKVSTIGAIGGQDVDYLGRRPSTVGLVVEGEEKLEVDFRCDIVCRYEGIALETTSASFLSGEHALDGACTI